MASRFLTRRPDGTLGLPQDTPRSGRKPGLAAEAASKEAVSPLGRGATVSARVWVVVVWC